jgi:hypothetical protein
MAPLIMYAHIHQLRINNYPLGWVIIKSMVLVDNF